MKLGKKLKEQDQFGTKAIIYMKKNHKTHKTLLGGIMSINVKICLYALIFFKFQDMFTRNNN